MAMTPSTAMTPSMAMTPSACGAADPSEQDYQACVAGLRSVYRAYHLPWLVHCDAIDRLSLRLRLSSKKRATIFAPTSASADPSVVPGSALPQSASSFSGPSANAATSSLSANPRTTRRTANSNGFGVGDAVSDAQFDIVLAHLGSADQKDPNIRAMKTTAVVPDMALRPSDRKALLMDPADDDQVEKPIEFYEISLVGSDSESASKGQRQWSKEEQEAFETSYTAQPKQFGYIAAQVRTKTRAQCVVHYYRTKHEKKYRNLLSCPSATLESKPREVRGKRSRKSTYKGPVAANVSQKPHQIKPSADSGAGANADDEGDEESMGPIPVEPVDTSPNLSAPGETGCQQSGDFKQSKAEAGIVSGNAPATAQSGGALAPAADLSLPSDPAHRISSPEPRWAAPAPSSPQSVGPPQDGRLNLRTGRASLPESKDVCPAAPPLEPLRARSPPTHPHPAPGSSSAGCSIPQTQAKSTNLHRTSFSDCSSPVIPQKRKAELVEIGASSALRPSQPSGESDTQVSMQSGGAAHATNSGHNTVPCSPLGDHGLHGGPLPSGKGDFAMAQRNARPQRRYSPPTLPPEHSREPGQHSTQNHSVISPRSVPRDVCTAPFPAEVDPCPGAANLPAPGHSTMQIRNLLNDDPVEPSAALSSMDADAWFGPSAQEEHQVEPVRHQAQASPFQLPARPRDSEILAGEAATPVTPMMQSYQPPRCSSSHVRLASSDTITSVNRHPNSDTGIGARHSADLSSASGLSLITRPYPGSSRSQFDTVMSSDQALGAYNSSAAKATLPTHLKPVRSYAAPELGGSEIYRYGAYTPPRSSNPPSLPSRIHSQSPRLPNLSNITPPAPRPARLAPITSLQQRQRTTNEPLYHPANRPRWSLHPPSLPYADTGWSVMPSVTRQDCGESHAAPQTGEQVRCFAPTDRLRGHQYLAMEVSNPGHNPSHPPQQISDPDPQ